MIRTLVLAVFVIASSTAANAQNHTWEARKQIACDKLGKAWLEVAYTGKLYGLSLKDYQQSVKAGRIDEETYNLARNVFRNAPTEPENAYKLGVAHCMDGKHLK